MFKNLGLKDKSISIVMLIIVILSSIFIYLNILEHRYSLDFNLDEKEDKVNKFINLFLEDISKFYTSRARENIILINDALKDGDEKKVYDLVLSNYGILRKENIFLKDMSFYASDNSLTVSLSNISTKSNSIVEEVNKNKKPAYGFEFTNNRLYYKIVHPIFYEDKYNGALEFSISPYQLVDKLDKFFKSLSSSIIYKNKDNEFVLNNCCTKHDGKFLKKVIKNIKSDKEHEIISVGDKHYIIHNHVNLKNFHNDYKATLFLVQNVTADIDFSQKIMLYSIIATIFIIIIVFFILQKSFGGMVRKIEHKDKELENFVEELENIVAERTKELQMSKEKYENIINSTSEGYWELNSNKETINVNNALCQMLEFTKEEMIGKTPFDFVDEENRKIFLAQTSKSLTIKNRTYEITLKSKLGKKIYTLFNATTIKCKEIIIFAFVTDISKQRNLLEQMKEEKISDIKLASIGKLAAGITHEINTPLTYIKGNLELLKFDLDSIEDKKLRDAMYLSMDIIFEGIVRISGIVNAMKEVTFKSDNKIEVTNLYSTLIYALRMVHHRAKNISNVYINSNLFTLDLDINQDEFLSAISKQRIEQVWIIILNNAVDEFTKVNMNFEDKFIDITMKKVKDKIHIFIKDNAGGIPDDILDKVFEPFISTKVDKGMGIGLNIAQKILKENGGSIKAYNDKTLKDVAVFEIVLKASSR